MLAAAVFGLTVMAYLVFLSHGPPSVAVLPWLAGSAAALAAMIVARLLGRPTHGPLAWILLGQVLAVAPDLALAAGVAHRPWMNVFLGHLEIGNASGGVIGWLIVVAVLAAGYAAQPTLQTPRTPD